MLTFLVRPPSVAASLLAFRVQFAKLLILKYQARSRLQFFVKILTVRDFDMSKIRLKQYVAAFRDIESAKFDEASSALKDLAANIARSVATEQRGVFWALLDAQLARLK